MTDQSSFFTLYMVNPGKIVLLEILVLKRTIGYGNIFIV